VKLLRWRTFSFSILAFPLVLYLTFGFTNAHGRTQGIPTALYLLAGYACFGTVTAALFGIGASLAFERAYGWLEVKLASPVPPLVFLFGRLVCCIGFAFMVVSILIVAGALVEGVHLTPVQVAKMFAVTVAGSIPFAAMGLLLALVMPANGATGIINLINLPMSLLAGVWVPVARLPHWVGQVAPYQPMYHLAQLMFSVFGCTSENSMAPHWAYLGGFTVLMLLLAGVAFRRTAN
jgi:ABC-2 type transport system permease protein